MRVERKKLYRKDWLVGISETLLVGVFLRPLDGGRLANGAVTHEEVVESAISRQLSARDLNSR